MAFNGQSSALYHICLKKKNREENFTFCRKYGRHNREKILLFAGSMVGIFHFHSKHIFLHDLPLLFKVILLEKSYMIA